MAQSAISKDSVKAFLKKNPTFDVLTFDFFNKETLKSLKLPNKKPDDSIQELKRYQRLMRIVNDHDLAHTLIEAGLESAHQITALTESGFIQKYGHLFNSDIEKAKDCYNSALGIRTRIQHACANIHSLTASSHSRIMNCNNVDPGLHEYLENIPSYQDLFGSLDYCGCEQCNSIFSPAAYFLDMMRITDNYITEPNSRNPIPPGYSLRERRPDLFELKLTCNNTNELVLFLSIVNNVLERRIAGELQVNSGNCQGAKESDVTLSSKASLKDGEYNGMTVIITAGTGLSQQRTITSYTGNTKIAKLESTWDIIPDAESEYLIAGNTYKELAAAKFPFNLPFNLPRNQIRRSLNNLNSSLSDIAEDLNPPVVTGVVQNSSGTTVTLDDNASPDSGAYNNMRLMIVSGSGAGEFRTIVSYKVTEKDKKVTKEAVVKSPWKTEPVKGSVYYIYNVFTARREMLGISPEQSADFTKVNDTAELLAPFYGEDTLDETDLAKVNVFLQKSGLSWDQLQDLLTQGLSTEEIKDGLANNLFINNTGQGLPAMQIVEDTTNPQNPYYKIDHTSILRFDRMQRFIRLADRTGVSFADLDWILQSVGAKEITEEFLSDLAEIIRLKNDFNIEYDSLCSLWSDIKQYGKGNGVNPADLFDRVFNDPSQLDGVNPYKSVDPFPFDPSRPITWEIDDLTGMNQVIRGRLLASLPVNDSELTALAKYVTTLIGNKTAQLETSVTNLSWLYRIALAATIMKISIDEYLRIDCLLYYPAENYLSPPKDSIQLSVERIILEKEIIDWYRSSTLLISGIFFILNKDSADNPLYKPDDVAPFINNLAGQSSDSKLGTNSFIFNDIDETESGRIFSILKNNKFLNDAGLVIPHVEAYVNAAIKHPFNEKSFEDELITPAESKQVFHELQSLKPPVLITDSNSGKVYLSSIFAENTDLSFLFPEDDDAANKRNEVRSSLMNVRTRIDIHEYAFIFPFDDNSFITDDITDSASVKVFNDLKSHSVLLPLDTNSCILNPDFDRDTKLEYLFASKGSGQNDVIIEYDGASRTAALQNDWKTVPDTTSLYEIIAIVAVGTAQGGSEQTIILDSDASGTDDEYYSMTISITDGVGKGQSRTVSGYTGSDKTATVSEKWDVIPDNTSVYSITNIVNEGYAQGADKNHITLSESASAVTDVYKGMTVAIIPDPLADHKRTEVAEKLLNVKSDIKNTGERVNSTEKIQNDLALNGVAEFLGTAPEMITGIIPFAVNAPDISPYVIDLLTPLTNEQVPQQISTFLSSLSRSAYLFASLVYLPEEITCISADPEAFNVQDPQKLTLSDIRYLSQFKNLQNLLGHTDNNLGECLIMPGNSGDTTAKISFLSQITGWNSDELTVLIKALWPDTINKNNYDFTTISGISQLKTSFYCSNATGISIQNLLKLSNVAALPVIDSNGKIIPANWKEYEDNAVITNGAVKARYPADEYAEIQKKTISHLGTQKRDALLGYAIWILNKKIPEIQKPSDLFQYLLIDVEMTGCDNISYISQAISSVQLYMQRCRMMLEKGISDIKIPAVWWEWMSSYRIWEVNRKIFLYPENYIDPGLKSDASPVFESLKEKLLQTNIDKASVDEAYRTYFDGFDDVASLEYCDSFHCPVTDPDTGEISNTLFIFGRTNTDPYVFYYRTYEASKNLWTPWQKIELTINAFYVTPVYAFNKLFLFWVETEQNVKTPIQNGTSGDEIKAYIGTIKYTFYNNSKQWVQEQTLKDKVVIDYVPDAYKAGFYIDPGFIDPESLYLQKLYALNLPPKTPPGDDNGKKSEPERIVLMYGSIYPLPTTDIEVPAKPDKSKYKDMNKYEFDMSIYETANRAEKSKDAFLPGYIFLSQIKIVYPNLLSENYHSIILDYNDIAGDPQPYRPVIDIKDSELKIEQSNNVIYDNYFSDDNPRNPDNKNSGGTEPESFPLLFNINQANSNIITVKNQPGWLFFDNGNEEFLLIADDPNLLTISDIAVEIDKSVSGLGNEFDFLTNKYTSSTIDFKNLKFKVYRLTTNTIFDLSQRLLSGGIEYLLTIDAQQIPELPFSRFYEDKTPPPNIIIPNPDTFNTLDFTGSYGLYFWEIFFHSPFLVAEQLHTNQCFEDAKLWFEYIFNPTQKPEKDDPHPNDRYWRFLPFRNLNLQSLTEILRNQAEITVYNNDPFDPHALARLRPGAYPKTIVMKYIDNLIAWGDSLFSQDTRESINQAMNLYVMAADILGKRPDKIGNCPVPDPKSYNQIKNEYDLVTKGHAQSGTAVTIVLAEEASSENGVYNGMTVKITGGTGQGQSRKIMSYDGNTKTASVYPAWSAVPDTSTFYQVSGIPEFLIQLENTPVGYSGNGQTEFTYIPFNDIQSYFCIPENPDLLEYWDRIEDRLFKIRHCMNIQGIERTLALFAPPINPHALVRAAAAGQIGGSIHSQLEPKIPYYRFDHVIEKAKNVASQLIQLGGALLGALEKKDAEALSLLSTTQEKVILNLTTSVKEKQIEEVVEQGNSLVESKNSALHRYNHYAGLIAAGLSPGEIANIVAMTIATVFNVIAGITKTASSIGYAVPQAGSPFAMTYGGKQIGAALNAASGALEIGSVLSNFAAQLSLTISGYQRRASEWGLQQTLADYDKKQITNQIAANDIRKQIAERELEIHLKSIEQNSEMEEYLKKKFTNEQLYQWMISRLSTVYFQTYLLAYDISKSAERAFQYEYNTDDTFITYGYWDNLKKGLCSGEELMLSLTQMEKSAMDNNSRYLEIEKTVSLLQHNPKALLDLKNKGECIFDLSEKLYDLDYPGHYCRKIVNISISIPALVGPFQNIKASLVQLSNHTIIKPDVQAVDYLLGGDNTETPGSDVLRTNWWVSQQIALSDGQDDSGIFELSFRDERYLPFEGTGAVSLWKLSMPIATNQIDMSNISDIIVKIRYTSIDGGGGFRKSVTSLDVLSEYYGANCLSLAHNFSQQWYTFMHDHPEKTAQTMDFPVSGSSFPIHLVKDSIRLDGLYLLLDLSGIETVESGESFIQLTAPGIDPIPVVIGQNNDFSYEFPHPKRPRVSKIEGEWEINFDLKKTPPSLKTKDGFLDENILNNIIFIMYYEGSVNWDI